MIRLKKNIFLFVLLIGFLLTACGKSDVINENKKGIEITVFNTGKSDCILIQMDDCVVLNDTAYEENFDEINQELKERKIEKIDYMIISHFDKDHVGSAARLLQNYQVSQVIMPDYVGNNNEYKNMMKVIEEKQISSNRLSGNQYEIASKKGKIVVDAAKQRQYDDENDFSLITDITYGKCSFLLTGDALKDRMGEFLETDLANEHVDVIKLPHHGDYYKNEKRLWQKTAPKAVIITEDEDTERLENKLVENLEEDGIKAYYTFNGSVMISSDGEKYEVTQ